MATATRNTVVGVFQDRAAAERAVDELERAGFTDEQIGFALRDEGGTQGTTETRVETDSRADEGLASGAIGGGVLGGLVGAAAALLIPGIGPVVAGGILATALSGAAIGALTGGVLGALVGAGVPEEEARYYENEFQAGRTIVTVRANGRGDQAMDILRRHGAYDVNTRGAEGAGGYGGAAAGAAAAGAGAYAAGNWDDVAPRYRSNWEARYAGTGGSWDEYEPGYRYGWERANDPRYRDREWSEVEPELRRDWETRYHDRPWDRFGAGIRDVWNDVRGGAYRAGDRAEDAWDAGTRGARGAAYEVGDKAEDAWDSTTREARREGEEARREDRDRL